MPPQLKCVKCTRVDHSTKNVVYILVATFGGGSVPIENRYVGKTVTDLSEFRKNVIQLSNNLKSSSSAVQLPDLKEKKGLMGGWKDDRNRASVDEFFQHLLKLPSEILQATAVTNFLLESSAVNEDDALKLQKNKDSVKKPLKDRGKGDVAVAAATPASPSPAVTSSHSMKSSSSDSSDMSYSLNTYEEIGCLSGLTASSNPPLSSIYSEVKAEESGSSRFIDTNSYAECVATTTTGRTQAPPAIKTVETTKVQMSRVTSEQPQLYASVHKPKIQPPAAKNDSSSFALYQDTSYFPAPLLDPELMLYEDAISTNSPRPVPPKPNLSKNSTAANYKQSSDVKPPTTPSKPPLTPPTPVSASVPLTPIPPMPQFPSPILQSLDTIRDDSPRGDDEVGEIQVVAIGDYDSTADNILSFRKGTLASLLVQSDSNWWCIRIGLVHGWVPAAYWRTLNSGECANLITKGNSPWFVGKLSRAECETLLMEHGKQQHFVVRESNKGHYALSVKYNDKIHHFPIEVTTDKKYNIGRHDFKTVNNVILYYQKNCLFHDDQGQEVTLGSPLIIVRH